MIAFWVLSLWECAVLGYKHLCHKPLAKTDHAWLICNILAFLLWGVVVIGWVSKGIPMCWMLVIYSVAMMLTTASQFGKRLLGGNLVLPDSRLYKTISEIVIGLFVVSAIAWIAFTIYLAVSFT